jgi:hypothetical protein
MTGVQNEMTRRDLGWVTAKVFSLAAGAEFFASWLRAGESHSGRATPAPPELDRWKNYQPKFFSPSEFAMLDAYTAILIPSDDTPGAREAYVAPFIDFVVNAAAEYAPDMQTEWRATMKWLREADFQQLPALRQTALIRQAAAPEHDRQATQAGYPAYRLIKNATIHAFYTSRAGLVDTLEYKGLAYLTQFPACDHPEHRKA